MNQLDPPAVTADVPASRFGNRSEADERLERIQQHYLECVDAAQRMHVRVTRRRELLPWDLAA